MYFNLKKTPGGDVTKNDQLAESIRQDAVFLKKQFQLYFSDITYGRDIIIACGSITSHKFNSIIEIPNRSEWMQTSRGIKYFEFGKNRFFIKYQHPAARVADNLLYYGLIDALKEIWSFEKNTNLAKKYP